ncbi:hypothetical protein JCM10213_008340 [Rhodosporidiobolus nylandii]
MLSRLIRGYSRHSSTLPVVVRAPTVACPTTLRHPVSSLKTEPIVSSAAFHHFPFALPARAMASKSSHAAGDTIPHSEVSSHPSTRKLLEWAREAPQSRTVEIVKHGEWNDEHPGDWTVEIYMQDVEAKEGTDLRKGSLVATAVGEAADDALAEAAGAALDLLKLAEKSDY